MKDRILIIAPHQDDEIIGLGGTIYHLSRQSEIFIVYTTEGNAPKNQTHLSEQGFKDLNDYSVQRRNEAKNACQIVGLKETNIHFMGLDDLRLCDNLSELESRLIDIFSDTNPKKIYTPTLEGAHPDHDATNVATYFALQKLKKMMIGLEYAIYTAAYGKEAYNTFVDDMNEKIELSDDEISAKKAALNEFKSQILPGRFMTRYLNDMPKHESARSLVKPSLDLIKKIMIDNPTYYELFYKLGIDKQRIFEQLSEFIAKHNKN